MWYGGARAHLAIASLLPDLIADHRHRPFLDVEKLVPGIGPIELARLARPQPARKGLSADWLRTVPRATGLPSLIQEGSMGMSGKAPAGVAADCSVAVDISLFPVS